MQIFGVYFVVLKPVSILELCIICLQFLCIHKDSQHHFGAHVLFFVNKRHTQRSARLQTYCAKSDVLVLTPGLLFQT